MDIQPPFYESKQATLIRLEAMDDAIRKEKDEEEEHLPDAIYPEKVGIKRRIFSLLKSLWK